jgi:hypothetical protein
MQVYLQISDYALRLRVRLTIGKMKFVKVGIASK